MGHKVSTMTVPNFKSSLSSKTIAAAALAVCIITAPDASAFCSANPKPQHQQVSVGGFVSAAPSCASRKRPLAGHPSRGREGTLLFFRSNRDGRGAANEDGIPSRSALRAAAVGIGTETRLPRRERKQLRRERKERKRDRSRTDASYEDRRKEWASRYTNVNTLRNTFGGNRNRLWGDFDPETTRRLYHTLLPRALLGAYDMGIMRPHELAPLAFEARVAAKKYARERCEVPGRVMAMAFDGFRQWKKYGKFDVGGMNWDQIWKKYEAQVQEELDMAKGMEELSEREQEEITKRICLRILERSCSTNEGVDRLLLTGERNPKKKEKEMDVAAIAAKLEQDVHELLLHRHDKKAAAQQRRQLKREERELRRERKKLEKQARRSSRMESKEQRQEATADDPPQRVTMSAQEIKLLRMIALTKRKIDAFRRGQQQTEAVCV